MSTNETVNPDRVVVAITGATGAILGIRLLQRLADFGVERHLIVSAWGARTIAHETNYDIKEVRKFADVTHKVTDLGATLSSGSFITRGMIIAPCSVKTLAALATGLSGDLIARAADVTLKERRRLILMVRESPLNQVHLENMLRLSQMGAAIVPPMASFYTKPTSLEEMTDHIVTRTLDQLGLHSDAAPRWDGELG